MSFLSGRLESLSRADDRAVCGRGILLCHFGLDGGVVAVEQTSLV